MTIDSMRTLRPPRLIRGGVVALVASVAFAAASAAPQPRDRPVAIIGATVIPATGATAIRDATVIVEGERIVRIGPRRQVRVPHGAQAIDGAGRFLIPGLIELHAHLSKTRASALGLFLANGVTTVRDMGGEAEELIRWRREVNAGARVGPRLLLAGPFLESTRNVARMRGTPVEEMAEPVERTRIAVGSPEDAARVVNALPLAEISHIKIRTVQDRDTYFAIARAARAVNKPLVGHVPQLPPEDILTAGQRSLDHGLAVLPQGTREERLAIYRRFAAARVAVVPTMITVPRSVFAEDDELRAFVDGRDPRVRYLSKFLLIDWREQATEQTPERKAFYRDFYPKGIAALREMREAGVLILAGSDVAVLNVLPGTGLHEELGLFVAELGMSPGEALERGTRLSAEFLGLQEVGAIAEGKIADLVLLDANPLTDIRNLGRVHAVVSRGRVFTRRDLDKVLAAVEAAPDRTANDWPRTR